mmetsp:Transcript_23287/g.71641  ORF Transcript_23287/g.71641 Transcript_23287/m.71641 type:complete len:227 (-) Transcript_23287:675-1355(-)
MNAVTASTSTSSDEKALSSNVTRPATFVCTASCRAASNGEHEACDTTGNVVSSSSLRSVSDGGEYTEASTATSSELAFCRRCAPSRDSSSTKNAREEEEDDDAASLTSPCKTRCQARRPACQRYRGVAWPGLKHETTTARWSSQCARCRATRSALKTTNSDHSAADGSSRARSVGRSSSSKVSSCRPASAKVTCSSNEEDAARSGARAATMDTERALRSAPPSSGE